MLRWFAIFVSLLLAAPAFGQVVTKPKAPPPEAVVEVDLPLTPEGWTTVPGAFVTVHGHPDAFDQLLALKKRADADMVDLSRSLRVPLGSMTHIYLAENDHQFRKLQPTKAPTWADGVAYPRMGLVLLRDNSVRGGMAKPLTTVLRHELVHILLGRAFAPEVPPTWLQEGFAQVWAGEVGPENTETLTQGAATGRLMTLHSLSRGFPGDPVQARIAYAQSADFIGWMQAEYGEAAVSELVWQLSQGTPIEGAIHEATGSFLDPLDEAWRSRLESAPIQLGVLANMDLLLGLGGVLLLIGGIARRRKFHRRLDEMEAEEAAMDALISGYLANRRT